MKNKAGILFMAQLPPPVHGAALRNKSLLDSKLLNENFNIISLPLKFAEDMKDLGKFSFKKVWLMIKHFFRMWWILSFRKIDLVYFTMSPSGGAFYRDLFFITLIKLYGKKRILHFRVKGIQKTSSSGLGRAMVRYAFKGSEIICLSKHQMGDMNGLTYKPPFIVPNGIKVETEFLPNSDDCHAKELNEPLILFLSNLSRKKGVPELIDALSILHKQGKRFRAVLVGGEWDLTFNNVNELLCTAGVLHLVTVAGSKYGADKFNLVRQADVFAFPTYFELFPGVILEAMQFGKAIVSTFEGSIPEIIDDGTTGLLVEQRNVEALAKAIGYFLDNPEERTVIGNHAREKFFREYTLSAFEEKMSEVFKAVINN